MGSKKKAPKKPKVPWTHEVVVPDPDFAGEWQAQVQAHEAQSYRPVVDQRLPEDVGGQPHVRIRYHLVWIPPPPIGLGTKR